MESKRLLDCCASDLVQMDKTALLHAIRASEGRVMVSETIVTTQSLLNNVTNAELAASLGADILLLNMFDSEAPRIMGMPANIPPEQTLHELQRLTGRIIGINLEAVDPKLAIEYDELWKMKPGRSAVRENWQWKPAVAYCRYADDFVLIVKSTGGNHQGGVSECARRQPETLAEHGQDPNHSC